MKASALILAGGESRRFGSDKSLLRVGGELLIERSLREWGRLFEDVVIACGAKKKFCLPGVTEAVDVYPERGPLGGVHAGLGAARFPWTFVVACDMPGIDADFVTELFQYAGEDCRIVLPRHDGILEPLCGLYHKDCFAVAERMLSEYRNCILEMYDVMPVRYVKTRNCFFNVNYPGDVDGIGRHTKNSSRRFKRRLMDFCSEKGLND